MWAFILLEKVKQLEKDLITAPSKDKLHEHESTLMICGEKLVRVLEILEQQTPSSSSSNSAHKRISITPSQSGLVLKVLKDILDRVMNSVSTVSFRVEIRVVFVNTLVDGFLLPSLLPICNNII